MEFIIGILLAAKSIFMVSGSLGTGKSTVALAPPTFRTAQGRLMIDCNIVNGFSPDLKTLAASGTDILVYLFVDVRPEGSRRSLVSMVAENHLWYDAVKGTYLVARTPLGDTLRTTAIDSALTAVQIYHGITIVTADKIPQTGRYSFVIQAVLGKAEIEALKNSTVDLMYFWGFRRPMLATEPYSYQELFPDRSIK